VRRIGRVGSLTVAASLALAGAAAADWLVTRQGDRIETRGAWRRQGATVVFTLPNGTLSSLRAEEIDFDASTRASAPAPVAPIAQEPKKKPVLVLKDENVAHVAPDGEAPAAPGKSPAAEKGDTGQAKVGVINWHQESREDGLVVTGTVQNNDPKLTATEVAVDVRIFSANGKLLVSGPASLSSATLPPGQSANFTVTFPLNEKPAALKFEVTSATVPPTAPAADQQ